MVRLQAEQWTEPLTHHGEGPVWDTQVDALRCVDMLAGDVLTIRDGHLVQRENFGEVAAAWRPRAGGGSLVAVERGFVLVDRGGQREVIGPLWSDHDIRMNEGGCSPDGSFYCGSMSYDAADGRGCLWRLASDGAVSVVLEDLTISNGLTFTAAGQQAYFIDTPTRRVDVLTFAESGGVVDRSPFVDLSVVPGQPDGLTVDADGGVWVAMWGGGAVQHVWPDGSLGDVVAVGVSQPSAVCFGGPELRQLFITTSRFGLDQTVEPAAGAVFIAEPGPRGVAVMPFGGER